MSTFLLAAFLLLFGIMNLFQTSIPTWVLGLFALAAGIMLLVSKAFPAAK